MVLLGHQVFRVSLVHQQVRVLQVVMVLLEQAVKVDQLDQTVLQVFLDLQVLMVLLEQAVKVDQLDQTVLQVFLDLQVLMVLLVLLV
jgi:hypothetical protein